MIEKASLLFLVVVFAAGCNPREAPGVKSIVKTLEDQATFEAQGRLKEDPSFYDVVGKCSEAAIPEGSVLVSQATGGHGIAYSSTYVSADSRDRIRLHFIRQLEEHEWKHIRSEEFMGHELHGFTKDYFRINVQLGGLSNDATYSIWCEDSRTLQ